MEPSTTPKLSVLPFSGTTLPEPQKPENSAPNFNGLQGANRPLSNPTSRRRQRTVKEAIQFLDSGLKLRKKKRMGAVEKIRAAKQPLSEAKRIIKQEKLAAIADPDRKKIDLSDAQELRVWLMRRDKGIWNPHSDFLARLEQQIAEGGMTEGAFREAAVILLDIVQPLPLTFRKSESGPA